MDREQGVRTAAERFIAAIAAGDGDGITSMMSTDAQRQLVETAVGRGFDVAAAPEAAAHIYAGPWMTLFASVAVDSVQIEGDRATVTYRHATYGSDADDAFVLVEVEGGWLVDSWAEDEDDDTIDLHA
jgi:hypothetical protein